MAHREVLESELQKFQIVLPSSQTQKLAEYCDELVRWNKKMNLTALRGTALVGRLVVEPVWIGLQLDFAGVLADIGSGNGSPAIPLRIIRQFETCHLIEARTKKAVFLRHLATTLQLSGVRIHRARFEDVAPALGRPDWITVQGVALTGDLLHSIRQVASSTTTVVWVTSRDTRPPWSPAKMLSVPFTETKVFLYQLDLS